MKAGKPGVCCGWFWSCVTVVLCGGGALLLADAPDAQGAPHAAPLQFVRRPLAEIVQAVASVTGQAIRFRSEATERVEVSLTLPAGEPDLVLRRLAEALDRVNIALVRERDPARGWFLVAFRRTAAAAPGTTEPEPLVVRVVAGRVRLKSERGEIDVRAGEQGAITDAGLLVPPRRIDPATVALWRGGSGGATSGSPRIASSEAEETNSRDRDLRLSGPEAPPDAVVVRAVGTTDQGETIVECRATGREPYRVVVEKGQKEVPVPVPENP